MEDRSVVDSVGLDSSVTAGIDSMGAGQIEVEPDSVVAYFRKKFTLSSAPIEGWLAVAGDQAYRFYMNDIYILGIDSEGFDRIERLDFATFSEFVKEGENTIAISVTDADGVPRNGMKFYMSLRLLPGEITETITRIKEQIQPRDIRVEDLQRAVILNKNRILE